MRTTDSTSRAPDHSLRRAATIALVAAIAVTASVPLHAQMTKGAAPLIAANVGRAMPALDDPTIVAIFDAANTWDIELAGIALKKSHNKDVRTFARMMAHDHRAVRKMGRDLAKKLKVKPTPPGKDFALYQDHLQALKALRSAKGAAFDKAYIDHEVTYHQAVIDAITNTLLPATSNAELKNLETTVAPNFQAHLAAAQKVQAGLGASE